MQVQIDTTDILERELNEELRIVTKKFTYKIPIVGQINSISSDRLQEKPDELYSEEINKKCRGVSQE